MFQRLMDRCLRFLIGEKVSVFLDDKIIRTKSYKEHKIILRHII
jgi:hypothetical protein